MATTRGGRHEVKGDQILAGLGPGGAGRGVGGLSVLPRRVCGPLYVL